MKHAAERFVVVTGSARGIGAAIVEAMLSGGWKVIGVDRDATRKRRGVDVITADLADISDLERVVVAIRGKTRALGAIVNNAAEQLVQALPETTLAEWDRSMAANVRPAYFLPAQLRSELSAGRGSIVNVASVHAIATSPGMASYVASKGALVSLTRAMALEFAAFGIRANAVLPGAINTPMLAAGLKRSKVSVGDLALRHPLRRLGTPQDVAEAVCFLADSSRSGFITGQTLVVDGGATARLSTE